MNLRFTFDYLRHFISSNSRHGTHSPFVYQLADEVIYDFSPKKVYEEVEKCRKKLLNDPRIIEVKDLGAGSRLTKNPERAVASIARHSLKSPKLAQLLYRIIAFHRPKQLVELGTCLGITTAYLAHSHAGVKVITMEGCPQTAAVAAEVFTELSLKNVDCRIGNFDVLLPACLGAMEEAEVVYIDGNHTKEATLRYFSQCLEKVTENSLLIFDDIYWSKGMKEAWEVIKANEQVTVTVDLFWIGLVYFRKGQARQHFTLRF